MMFEAIASSCQRCGYGPLVGADGNPNARLMRHAHAGLCASCAVTEFLKMIPTTAMAVQRNGVEMFRNPDVQAQFARIMQSGQADAGPSEIDWERVITNWDKPDPAVGRTGRGRR